MDFILRKRDLERKEFVVVWNQRLETRRNKNYAYKRTMSVRLQEKQKKTAVEPRGRHSPFKSEKLKDLLSVDDRWLTRKQIMDELDWSFFTAGHAICTLRYEGVKQKGALLTRPVNPKRPHGTKEYSWRGQ